MDEHTHPTWRRSSHSTSGENCVELAALPTGITLRDSKNPVGPYLAVARPAFRHLIEQIRLKPLNVR